MPDNYSYIVYVMPTPPVPSELPAELDTFQRLCWEHSATIRWRCADPADLAASLSGNVLLIVVDCDADAAAVRGVYQDVRQVCQTPMLLIDSGRLRPEALQRVKAKGASALVQKGELSDSSAILRILNALAVELPQSQVNLDYEQNDPVMAELVQWVGEERLKNDIQKFFPQAQEVQVRPVAGGWSGAKLCRIFVQGQKYFLKFFEDSTECRREHERHGDAMAWLRQAEADVPIRPVPDISDDVDSQLRAFPQRRPVAYPVCYVSASPGDYEHETLKALYRTKDEAFVKGAFGRLLEILATGQEAGPTPESEPPWGFGALDAKTKVRIMGSLSLDDLGVYGPPMCGNSSEEWESRRRLLKLLVFQLPTWLCDPVPVWRGHTHGDPNPRNCLLPSDNCNDIRLIDCGDYEATGRLVSDLALIERDIKLVLMSTEEEADKFFDLDTRRLIDWCKNEQNSIGRGIEFEPRDALTSPSGEFPSANRAYRLVGLVRERAKAVCRESDSGGIQYFAALLYWTLDALKYEAIRPTKKLLALYSASEILLKFQEK